MAIPQQRVVLLKRRLRDEEERHAAILALLIRARQVETHHRCLYLLMRAKANPNEYKDFLSVKDAKGNATVKKISECDVQTTLAVHLFEPLVLNSKIVADASSYIKSGSKPQCRFCSRKVIVGDTSLGNNKTWHGIADILLEQSLVKVENKVADQEGLDETLNQDETLDGSGEPRGPQPSTSKRPRLDHHGDHEAGRSDENGEEKVTNVIECELSSSDTYMPDGPQKLSAMSTDSTLAQVLAQTIVNAFLQARLKPELRNSFIPAFLVSDLYITIHMYNPGSDVLLTQSGAMSIFKTDGSLNTKTMLSLWLALNMHHFSKALPNEPVFNPVLSGIPKSNFRKFMQEASKFDIYTNHMEMPLSSRPCAHIRDATTRNCDASSDYVKKCLEYLVGQEPGTKSETLDQSVSILQSIQGKKSR